MKIFLAILRSVGAFVVVFGGIFLLVLVPRLETHVDQKEALARLQDQYIFQKWQLLQLDDLRVQLRELEAVLDRLSAMLPMTFDGDAAHVAEAARHTRVRVESSLPSRETKREFYSMRGMRIRASGRFHDLGAFAAELGRAPGCLRLQDIDLRRSSAAGQVTMEAVVWVHRYLDDAEVAEQRKDAARRKQ